MRAWRRPDRCARARRDHPLTAGQRRRLAWRHRLQQGECVVTILGSAVRIAAKR
jgi:hypothetical protein